MGDVSDRLCPACKELRPLKGVPYDPNLIYGEWSANYHPYNQLEGNLNGWVQLRKLIHRERIDRCDPSEEEVAS